MASLSELSGWAHSLTQDGLDRVVLPLTRALGRFPLTSAAQACRGFSLPWYAL